MCGIFGWIKFDRDFTAEEREASHRAVGQLQHRGPDAVGMIEEPRLFVGHRRLSIIDLSHAADQPFQRQGSRKALAFNGEIYNYIELREELERDGTQFHTQSDTEVLFAMLERSGENALPKLDGMFTAAWHDLDAQSCLLIRDALGQKPLYYALRDNELVYASELRCLLGLPGFGWQLDPHAFKRYLTLGYYAWDESPVCGIRKLRPGHFLRVAKGKVEHARWWHSRPGAQTIDISPEAAVTQLIDRFETACSRTLRSDVPVGIFLSGGIDSTLVYDMCRRLGADTQSFTVRFDEPDYDESAKAREVVAKTAIGGNSGSHHEIRITPDDLRSDLVELFGCMDEPHADPGYVNAYALSRAARKHITVAISGDGADELFCGYLPFRASLYASKLQRLPRFVTPLARRAARLLPGSDTYLGLRFKARSFLNGLHADPAKRMNLWLATEPAELLTALFRLPPENMSRHGRGGFFDFPREVSDAYASMGPLDQLSHYYQQVFLPEFVCHHTDRASMLHGLEVRSPFLSTQFIEFANQLPASIRMHKGVSKWPLRAALKRLGYSDAIVHQPKQGFTVPLARWQKNEFRDETLAVADHAAAACDGQIDDKVIKSIVADHLSGAENHYRVIHALSVFMAWRSRYSMIGFTPS